MGLATKAVTGAARTAAGVTGMAAGAASLAWDIGKIPLTIGSGAGKLMAKLTDKRRGPTWFSRPSRGISHSEFVPRIATGAGAAVVTAGAIGMSLVSDIFHGLGNGVTGKVSYANGASKMTNGYTTGVVEAMHNAAQGDYGIFSELADDVLSSPNLIAKIDDLGANPKMIRSLYNMR